MFCKEKEKVLCSNRTWNWEFWYITCLMHHSPISLPIMCPLTTTDFPSVNYILSRMSDPCKHTRGEQLKNIVSHTFPFHSISRNCDRKNHNGKSCPTIGMSFGHILRTFVHIFMLHSLHSFNHIFYLRSFHSFAIGVSPSINCQLT